MGEVDRRRWGESEAGELTVSPNRRATLSLKGMVMRTSAAEGEEVSAVGVGGNPRNEAQIPRGPKGEKEGEGGCSQGVSPFGRTTVRSGRPMRGATKKGVGERPVLVVVFGSSQGTSSSRSSRRSSI